MDFCAAIIEENIKLWDTYLELIEEEKKAEEREEKEGEDLDKNAAKNQVQWHQIKVGSCQRAVKYKDIEATHSSDPAFNRFRLRLQDYLTALLADPTGHSSFASDSNSSDLRPHTQATSAGHDLLTLHAKDEVRAEIYH